MHKALYREYRPLVFDDVIGQDHIIRTLKNQIKENSMSHAYLFCGTRGTGKTTTAKILSRAVNCQAGDQDHPCNQCPSCQSILDSSNLDVIEIDAASNNSVDDIRELRDTVKYTPANSKYKVYIIDEVHMLSQGAFNALLKTLEEAPEHVIMILLCENENKLLDTVLSRVVRVYVGDMPIDKQWKLLQEIPALRALPAFLKEIAHKKQEEMQKYAEELGQLDGQELYCFLDIILRDVLCDKSTKDHHLLYGQSARESITAMAEKYSYWTLGQWGEYIERYKEGRAVNVAQNYQILDFFLFLSNT